jgi:flavin reductase (DIM6/NTAB) family NADH-FMN oxidoreductase RutF
MSLDTSPAAFRRVLGHYPTGVCVITAVEADAMPIGMAVGSFSSVSLEPPLIAFFPDKSSTTWPRIERTGRFCVNVLADHQEEVCRAFAMRGNDKFAVVSHRPSLAGLPQLDDTVAWIDCDIHAVHEAGDHWIVLGLVRALDVNEAARPLLFFQSRYGQFAPLQVPGRKS